MSKLRPFHVLIAAAAAAGLTLTACGSNDVVPVSQAGAGTITVQTNTGELTVPVKPERVVALDSTSFETLHEFGITPVAVPKELLPASLSEWADNPAIIDVGTHREPRLEEINAAEPDLIVGGKRFAEYTETLSSTAPVVDLAPSVEAAEYVDALKHQTTVLGEIFQAQSEAERLNTELDAAVAEAAGLTNGQTVFLANHNGGKIDNGGGRMAPLIEPLDMTDVFAADRGGSDQVHNDSGLSPETIAQANPDWVFVLDRDASTGSGGAPAQATIEAQELWGNTTFMSEGQVLYLDNDFYRTEGISAYTNFYLQLAEALQGTV
ncbi:MAG: ABC transporter substrate-binding protein [Brooklawnia sp.]|uniref:siderophore ABC transporter substrate-binding protein n=1 Tax=Brooklawnia sp. TaxID=2699740 RepID=UPI003C763076